MKDAYRYINRRYTSGSVLAHSMVAKAKRLGLLPSAKQFNCTDCSGPAIEYDHRDYNKPLAVVPVCRRCNILRKSAIPKTWDSLEIFYAYLKTCDSLRAFEQCRGFDMTKHTRPVLKEGA